jgi:predicted nucleic acid-binding Zn ribbon protein
MALFPIKTCVVCGEEFELKPGKPGFANRCPSCSEPEEDESCASTCQDAFESSNESDLNAVRRHVMRDMLYRKDS